MKKIGFYGGCFNPPTLAHINLAVRALEEFKLDKLYFVPVGNSYNKQDLADENHRFNMLELAVKKLKQHRKIEVLNIEIGKDKNFKANEIFKIIQEQYNKSENFFIMGADNFVNILSWENSKKLIEEYKYIILKREGFDISKFIEQNLKQYSDNFKILENKQYNISSTEARKLISCGKLDEIKIYIDADVIKYIQDNNLFKKLVYKE